MTAPSKQLDQFVVRLPDGMRDRIKAAAEANNRSMNAEIVATLEEKYPPPEIDTTALLVRWSDLLKEYSALSDRYREAKTQEEIDVINSDMDRIEAEIDELKIGLREYL